MSLELRVDPFQEATDDSGKRNGRTVPLVIHTMTLYGAGQEIGVKEIL